MALGGIIAVVSLTAIGISALSVLITERDRMMKEREREEEAFRDYFILWGDVPFIPEGARQQRAIGGSNSLTTDAQDRTNKVIARPHNGSVTR